MTTSRTMTAERMRDVFDDAALRRVTHAARGLDHDAVVRPDDQTDHARRLVLRTRIPELLTQPGHALELLETIHVMLEDSARRPAP